MAIEFLDDVTVEAELTVKPESGDGLLTINSAATYGTSRIYMGNAAQPEAGLLLTYANPGASYCMLQYNIGTGTSEIRLKPVQIDFSFQGSTSPITRMTSTGLGINLGSSVSPSEKLEVNGNFKLTGAFKDSSGDSGTSGQVLSSTGSGTNWTASGGSGSSGPSLITSGGGRVYVQTSTDDNARAVVMGGSIGFSYYNWSIPLISYANLSFSGLGTPNTSVTQVTPASAAQGAFQVLQSGTVSIQGTVEGQNSADIYSEDVYIYVFKIPAAIVTAMGNGGAQNATNYTLVASAVCTMPTTGASARPQSFQSTNGVSVNAGDWVLGAVSFDGVVTATRYLYTNFQMLTTP